MGAIIDTDVSSTSDVQPTTSAILLKGGPLDKVLRRMNQVLQAGDLIFIERRGWFYRHIARATGSWASQVGLCLCDANGRWVVYEGAVPMVRRVDLETFIRRTRGNRFAIRRLIPPPTPDQLLLLTVAADQRVGRYNGYGFDFDSKQLFGPKLIHEVFSAVFGRGPGQVISIADLRGQVPRRTLWFWRVWYLGAIPWQRRTMTPHSLYTDPGLETVFESF